MILGALLLLLLGLAVVIGDSGARTTEAARDRARAGEGKDVAAALSGCGWVAVAVVVFGLALVVMAAIVSTGYAW